jgi:hypothetical protein
MNWDYFVLIKFFLDTNADITNIAINCYFNVILTKKWSFHLISTTITTIPCQASL